MTLDELSVLAQTTWVGLWPKSAITPRQLEMIYRDAQHYTIAEAESALEAHASESRFAPGPGEFVKKLKSIGYTRRDQEIRTNTAAGWDIYDGECEREREERDRIWDEMEPHNREAHKASCLADWRLGWLKGKPVESVAWRHLIYRRVRDGQAPHDPPPYTIPPHDVPTSSVSGTDATAEEAIAASTIGSKTFQEVLPLD